MLSSPLALLHLTALTRTVSAFFSISPKRSRSFRVRADLRPPLLLSSTSSAPPPKSSAILDTLRVLEWDKVCDCVSSFAGTSLGRDATKAQLWSVDMSYEESKRLLGETAAAVEMMKCGIGGMDFSGFDAAMVKSAIERALRGFPVNGTEAMAVANLIQSAETLQINLKSSSKDDANSYSHFMPLAEVILELPVNLSVLNSINQVIDEDGSVKDSASTELKRLREQVRVLEKKLYHLMEKLVGLESDEASSLDINIVNGRWCLKVVSDHARKHEGLLLSSGTGFETLVEPLVAVPLNDELQKARSLATRAEEEVLSKLTDKMLAEVDGIQILLDTIIQLDVVIARAKYSITYGGTFPELSLPEDKKGFLNSEVRDSSKFNLSSSKWKLYARGAYHPLLLQQYQENLQMAKKDVSVSTSELRRLKLQGRVMIPNDKMESTITSLKLKIMKMEEKHPVPIDFTVSMKTNVVVITGPNTGGKTISLKTIGLSALMAKTGLYVIASEPVQMPWFDAVFADIGDEQSLSQSLSTFSGHLKRISAIQLNSTKLSLILLDEVGAGTNPLEGAALGMSLLESFADSGAYLTIATTHHGELKTLKYSNHLFENACMEFDEVNLKPTYKILWGVPGRSNAFNIAERIGICRRIIDNARELYGTASAEINEIILDMETFKQEFEHHLQETQQKIKLTREYHGGLLVAEQRVKIHNRMLQTRKMQAVRDTASVARSLVRNKLREIREDRVKQIAQAMSGATCSSPVEGGDFPNDAEVCNEPSLPDGREVENISPAPNIEKSNVTRAEIRKELPKVGDEVLVFSLGKKAIVLKVDASKEEVMVQANKMKLRLKLRDIELQRPQK